MNSRTVWASLLKKYEQDLFKLFTHTPLDKDSLEYLASSEWFKKSAWGIATRMVNGAVKGNFKSWQEAAFRSKRSREVFTSLQRSLQGTLIGSSVATSIQQNASLISSLPLDIAQYITQYAEKQYIKGGRTPEIEKEILAKIPSLALSRVKLIARTELSKTETVLTKARSESMGINFYEWLSSKDQRTRRSHLFMHEVLVPWNNPPSPETLVKESSYGVYHAGEIFNCRCTAIPLIDYTEVSWPHKCYVDNQVKVLTLHQFKQLSTQGSLV